MAKKLKFKTEAEVAAFNAGAEAAMKACLQAVHLEAKDWRGAARRVARDGHYADALVSRARGEALGEFENEIRSACESVRR